ncbi:hypothetical protein H0H87_010733, partial [Tephrocybe sp. NHM501043]
MGATLSTPRTTEHQRRRLHSEPAQRSGHHAQGQTPGLSARPQFPRRNDFSPVIPREFEQSLPISRRPSSASRNPPTPSHASPWPPTPRIQQTHTPVIPEEFGHLMPPTPTFRPPISQPAEGSTPRRNASMREIPITQHIQEHRRSEATPQSRRRTSRSSTRGLSPFTVEITMRSPGMILSDPALFFHINHWMTEREERTGARAQERPESSRLAGRHVAGTGERQHSFVEDSHESPPEEDLDESGSPPVPVSRPRRMPRAPTPFQPPRELDPSIMSPTSPTLSDLSVLRAVPNLRTPSQITEARPPNPRHGSITSRQRSESSYSTALGSPSTPTTSPTTPASQTYAHSTRRSESYLDYQSPPNPLPPPPVDIFTLPEYQDLWNRLQSHKPTPQSNPDVNPSATPQVQKQKKGLLRMFSRKKSAPPARAPSIRYLMVQAPTGPIQQGDTTTPLTPSTSHLTSQAVSHSQHLEPLATVTNQPHPSATFNDQGPSNSLPNLGSRSIEIPSTFTSNNASNYSSTSQPGVQSTISPQPRQRIIFDEHSERSYFLMHSPHHVIYENAEYPTAAHLLEALKFLPDHPAIAERIRLCQDLTQAQHIATENRAFEHPNFAGDLVENAKKAILLKFSQNSNLRYNICNLDRDAEIIYNDPLDSFWGIGADGKGSNELGKILGYVMRTLKPQRVKPAIPSRTVFNNIVHTGPM